MSHLKSKSSRNAKHKVSPSSSPSPSPSLIFSPEQIIRARATPAASESVTVGLDISVSNTGIAVITSSGVFCYSLGFKMESPTEREHLNAMLRITAGVINFLKVYVRQTSLTSPISVGIEDYAYGCKNTKSLTKLAELNGIMKSQIAAHFKTVPTRLAATTIRKFLTGRGSSKKEEVESWLRRLGYTQASNADEWDALAVALVIEVWQRSRSEKQEDIVSSFTEYQRSVFAEMDKKRY